MNAFSKNIIYWCLFFIIPQVAFSQNNNIDSLKLLLLSTKPDSVKLGLLVKLSSISDANEVLNYGIAAVELADRLHSDTKNLSLLNKRRILIQKASALCNIGYAKEQSGDIINALSYYNKSMKICEETGDKPGIATALNNIGALIDEQGNTQEALKCYERSLKIREEIGDKQGVAASLNNIGFIYKTQGETDKALDNYNACLKIQEEIGDKEGIASSFNNIGVVHNRLGNLNTAMEYLNKSLKIREEIGDKRGIARSLNNIGIMYKNRGELSLALNYFNKSLEIKEEINDKQGVANSFYSIGMIYLRRAVLATTTGDRKKLLDMAILYSNRSLVLSKELGFPENIRPVEETLSKIDSIRGNFAGAFEHYKQFILYRDSISNNENRKASIKSQLKYEYEKKEAVIKEQREKERAISEEKNRRQQIAIWSVAAGLFLVIGFAIFVFRSLKITRQQKVIIEEKQKEILDSINYAKRIQMALIPSEKQIHQILEKLKTHEGK